MSKHVSCHHHLRHRLHTIEVGACSMCQEEEDTYLLV